MQEQSVYHVFIVELKILYRLEQEILHCWLPMTVNKRKFIEHTQLSLFYRKDHYSANLTVNYVMVSVTVPCNYRLYRAHCYNSLSLMYISNSVS